MVTQKTHMCKYGSQTPPSHHSCWLKKKGKGVSTSSLVGETWKRSGHWFLWSYAPSSSNEHFLHNQIQWSCQSLRWKAKLKCRNSYPLINLPQIILTFPSFASFSLHRTYWEVTLYSKVQVNSWTWPPKPGVQNQKPTAHCSKVECTTFRVFLLWGSTRPPPLF